ncbi:hypothetical protein [Photobacterium indicum]|uniref:hypothetical protein n=1 Tax=Photobacterium indicum TaxID=81447 RepID=UPI003D112AC2
MNTNMKVLAATVAVITSSSALAAAVTGTAGTEIHWDGKVPYEFADEGIILTGQHGIPLTEALKGGDLYLAKDGTYTSSSIPLELHYRACEGGGTGTGITNTDGVCDTSAGAWVEGEGKDAIGDITLNSKWAVASVRYTVGGRNDAVLADTAEIQLAGTKLDTTPTGITGNTAVFTTVNTAKAAAGSEPAPTTKYAVFASITASTGI